MSTRGHWLNFIYIQCMYIPSTSGSLASLGELNSKQKFFSTVNCKNVIFRELSCLRFYGTIPCLRSSKGHIKFLCKASKIEWVMTVWSLCAEVGENRCTPYVLQRIVNYSFHTVCTSLRAFSLSVTTFARRNNVTWVIGTWNSDVWSGTNPPVGRLPIALHGPPQRW